jgi:predicted lipid-binding transport protein (Tim44 family)
MFVAQVSRWFGGLIAGGTLGILYVLVTILLLFRWIRFPPINRELTMDSAIELERLFQSNHSVGFGVL